MKKMVLLGPMVFCVIVVGLIFYRITTKDEQSSTNNIFNSSFSTDVRCCKDVA